MVDSQSFPVHSVDQASNKIVKGAYSAEATYSLTDIQALTAYASDRGVRMMFEIDVPGQLQIWSSGMLCCET